MKKDKQLCHSSYIHNHEGFVDICDFTHPLRTARHYPPAIRSASVNHGASSARHRGLLGGRAERRGEDPRRDARAAQRRVGPAVDALDRRSTWTSYFGQ